MNKLKNKNRKSIKSRKSKKSLNKNRVRPSRKTRKTRKTRKSKNLRKARKTGGLRLNFKDNSGIEHLYTSKERNLNKYKKADPSVVRINDYVCIKDSALEDMNNLLYELFIRRFKDSTNSRNLHRAKSLSLTDFFKSSDN